MKRFISVVTGSLISFSLDSFAMQFESKETAANLLLEEESRKENDEFIKTLLAHYNPSNLETFSNIFFSEFLNERGEDYTSSEPSVKKQIIYNQLGYDEGLGILHENFDYPDGGYS